MANPTSYRAAICDLNGVLRGKRVKPAAIQSVLDGQLRMPLSTISSDVWGNDTSSARVMFATGDQDGICEHTGRGPISMPWLQNEAALVPLWMFHEDGAPYPGDPRQALDGVVKRLSKAGLNAVVGTELEFYLLERDTVMPSEPLALDTGAKLSSNNVLSLEDMDGMEPLFEALFKACEANGVAAETAISEGGAGQFEVTMEHTDDPLKAADDIILFRTILRGLARKHGLTATFMAKPYLERSGNGLHVHTSIIDKDGRNIFDDGTARGTEELPFAVSGLLSLMREATLIFAPHRNSYRRFEPGSHAPCQIAWGYENRTASIRIPGGSTKARRIEHRVAGGDSNPYLLLASILGGIEYGLSKRQRPPPPVSGNVYESDASNLPQNWRSAISAFKNGDLIKSIFPEVLINNLTACKEQEIEKFQAPLTPFEIKTGIDVI